MQYDVLYNNKVVGNVVTKNDGLYVNFTCECKLPIKAIYRLYAIYGDIKMKLGVCMPEGVKYVLSKKLPRAYLLDCMPTFHIESDNEDTVHYFPINNELPFEHIYALPQGKICETNNNILIAIDKACINPNHS